MNPNVSGSLVLGGYDSSRVISQPIVSNSQTVSLTNIALNVSSGENAYIGDASLPITGLLQANGSSTSQLDVSLDPGVPYMYLPKSTCDAIAANLPLTYNPDFNLYTWNITNPAYEKIVSSPHYIAFNFSNSATPSGSSTIKVPLAVLNLTLESPLVRSDTFYFPCSPWEGNGANYTLRRAFLQSAFLAQNWNSSTLFLAQAPGPDMLSPSLKTISTSDTTLSPAVNPPNWESTWSSTLPSLNSNGSTSAKHDKLSGGAIAGIVVGVIVFLALLAGIVLWLLRRRRQTNHKGQDIPLESDAKGHYPDHSNGTAPPPTYFDHQPLVEDEKRGDGAVQQLPDNEVQPLAEAPPNELNDPVEMPAVQPSPQELDSRLAK